MILLFTLQHISQDLGFKPLFRSMFLIIVFNYRPLDNISIRFGSKLYEQIVGIPMGINCAPLFADLFLFCYEREYMLSLSDNNQTDIIEAFNFTSRYLDDLLTIDNPYFEQIVGSICY